MSYNHVSFKCVREGIIKACTHGATYDQICEKVSYDTTNQLVRQLNNLQDNWCSVDGIVMKLVRFGDKYFTFTWGAYKLYVESLQERSRLRDQLQKLGEEATKAVATH